eukprot:13569662-Alexandrium_andersonii.AAC.1
MARRDARCCIEVNRRGRSHMVSRSAYTGQPHPSLACAFALDAPWPVVPSVFSVTLASAGSPDDRPS